MEAQITRDPVLQRYRPESELGELLGAQIKLDPTLPALKGCGVICELMSLAGPHTNQTLQNGAEHKTRQEAPFWLDISCPDLVPGLSTATPEQEHEQVLGLVKRQLHDQGVFHDEEQTCVINVREFVCDSRNPSAVKKAKLYIIFNSEMLITVHDGAHQSIQCAKQLQHSKDINSPVRVAALLLEATVDPLNQVLHNFERRQSWLLEKNAEPGGLNSDDLASLPRLARTVGYIKQRALAMGNAIAFFESFVSDQKEALGSGVQDFVSDRFRPLSEHLKIYGQRCRSLLENIQMLQNSVQIAEQHRTSELQQAANERQQVFSNRFTLLAAALGPPGIATSFAQAFQLNNLWASSVLVASLAASALLIALRNQRIPWLDDVK